MDMQLEGLIKRARAYWFVDGFTEMATGGFFVLLSGILLIRLKAAQATLPARFVELAGEISIAKLFGLLAFVLILWWLKDHYTYPRTGFVRGNRVTMAQASTVIRNMVLFLLLPVFGLAAVSLFILPAGQVAATMPAWFPVGLGLLWAVLFILAGEWLGLRRFRLLGGLTLLAAIFIGLWQSAIGLPGIPTDAAGGALEAMVLDRVTRTLTGLGLLTILCGFILISSGLVTFLRYRRENPTPYLEDV